MSCINSSTFFEINSFSPSRGEKRGFGERFGFFAWIKATLHCKFNHSLQFLNTSFRGKITSDIITI